MLKLLPSCKGQFAIFWFLAIALILAPEALAANSAADISSLKQKAQSGDAQAQTTLGLAYREGDGAPADDGKAAEWFWKAAHQGNPVAQNALGVLYRIGRGVPKDLDQAFQLYKKSAAQKYAPGVFNTGISYYNGDGVPVDMVMAYAWMLYADELGEKAAHDAVVRTAAELEGRATDGELKLARLLDTGVELPRDETGAARWYRIAAEHGNAEAQVRYGLMLKDGRGTAQNPGEALQWLERAAQQKSGLAMFTLGYAYQKGILGQQVDVKKAIQWYEGAATQGHPGAMVNLGLMQMDGTAGPPNFQKAYFWFYMADAFKIPQAKAGIATASSHLSSKEIAKTQDAVGAWWQKHGTTVLLVRRPEAEPTNTDLVPENGKQQPTSK